MMERSMSSINIEEIDVSIVGGGPAGLASAVELYKKGIRSMLIIVREKQRGGILRQCIHDGFGLTRFKTTLSLSLIHISGKCRTAALSARRLWYTVR